MNASFEQLQHISSLINTGNEQEARNQLIAILDKEEKPYSNLLNHLLREVGLYPYMDYETSPWYDKIICELFKVNLGNNENKILHREQGAVLKELLNGKDVVLSAPTSFGKSFIIDALIAAKLPDIIVIIVPTIALMDEARRRLTNKFSSQYKIITTPEETLSEKVILIFPQERLFSYLPKLDQIDLFIVDEFYKVSKSFDSERSDILLNAIMRGSKIAKQRYFLCPNIDNIKESLYLQNALFITKLDFNTVITNIIDLSNNIHGKSDEEKNSDKLKLLKKLLVDIQNEKTLIYAGSFSSIETICNTLNASLPEIHNSTLLQFSEWLKKNYSSDFILSNFVIKGIGSHNGRLHRSLSQIETKLFDDENPLQYMVSTSSLIEGVNTSASNVIMWKRINGNGNLKYMDYKNLLGRSGRMFKHFIGKVYLLESPIKEEKIQLELSFTDGVQGDIDISEYEDYLSDTDVKNIKQKQIDLSQIIGEESLNKLLANHTLQSSNWNTLLSIAKDMKDNPGKWTYLKMLNSNNKKNWKQPLVNILFASGLFKRPPIDYYVLADFIIFLSFNWDVSLVRLLKSLKQKGISIENYFDYERKVSFYLATLLHDINELQKIIIPQMHCDISSFSSKLTYAFLPPNVFYLEEYGLPRMISKKIQNSGIIDLENEEKKISDIIKDFLYIGCDKVINSIPSFEDFDKKIIEWFYEGIVCK